MTFVEKPGADITTGDIEADRHHRRGEKRSAVTINHDLTLLRKMFALGIRELRLRWLAGDVDARYIVRDSP
jgi:hypothetical protein